MKLVYNKLNVSFNIRNDMLNFIIIESNRYFEDFIISLYEQIKKKSESLGFYKSNKAENLHKYADIICSPMDITYDKKEIQKKLIEILISEIQESDALERFIDIHSEYVNVFERVKEESEFDIEFNEEFDLNILIKEFGIQLEEPKGCFAEKVIEYMQVIRTLLNKNIFILINCVPYLSKSDYEHIQKWAVYQEIYVLFINSRQIELNLDINEYIIDTDLCEIH